MGTADSSDSNPLRDGTALRGEATPTVSGKAVAIAFVAVVLVGAAGAVLAFRVLGQERVRQVGDLKEREKSGVQSIATGASPSGTAPGLPVTTLGSAAAPAGSAASNGCRPGAGGSASNGSDPGAPAGAGAMCPPEP
jgi:hypothetical protein